MKTGVKLVRLGLRVITAARLERLSFANGEELGFGSDVHGDGVLEAVEDLVRGVLQAGVGLVELAGSLGGELTELVAVGDVGECTEDEI